MRSLLAFLAFLVNGSLFCTFSLAASAGPASVFHTDRTPDGKPIVIIRITASSDNQDELNTQYIFQSEKGFLGPSSNPTDQSGFANQDNSVFGVSYEPVTKACFVKLFLLNPSGTLVLVNNVNTRAAKFLPHRWAENAREFLRIEKIVGRRVYLQTTDFATGERPNFNFSVIVTRDGTLTAYEANAKK
jgi:hypothetical protein